MKLTQRLTAWMSAAALLLGATATEAQTLLWGAGHPDPVIDSLGEFTFPNATDSVFAAVNDSTWGCISVFDSAAFDAQGAMTRSRMPGNAFWRRRTIGRSYGGYWGTQQPINAPTASSGIAVYDADYFDNNGVRNAFGTGPTPAFSRSEIISPIIDLTGYTDSSLTVRFYLGYRFFNPRTHTVGLSTDNGVTWTDVDIRDISPFAVNRAFEGWVNANFRTALAGVTNLTQCRLRFVFEGYYYYQMVDDVSIFVTPDYDLSISGTTNGNFLEDDLTVAFVSGNRYTPLSQVDSNEFFFAARVLNDGAKDLFAATSNARLMLLIERDNGGTWVQEYLDSLPVDTALAGVRRILDPKQINWLPNQVGTYRARYFVKHDLPDFSANNDSSTLIFNITENYLSKCRLATADGRVAATTAVFPAGEAGSLVQGFEYGSMYYFPKGRRANLKIDTLHYRAFGPTTGLAVSSAIVNVRIYRFMNNPGSTNPGNTTLETTVPATELTLLGLAIDTVPLTAGQYTYRGIPGDKIINIIDPDSTFRFMDTTVYFITLEQMGGTNGLENGNAASRQYFGAFYGADQVNYAMHYLYSGVPNNGFFASIHPSPNRTQRRPLAGGTGTNTWNRVGFGADIQPAIALSLDTVSNTIVSLERTVLEGEFKLFPNPTKTQINIEVSLAAMSNNANFILTDASGRVISVENRSNFQQETLSLNVEQLPAGIYFVTIQTETGSATQRFVKQ